MTACWWRLSHVKQSWTTQVSWCHCVIPPLEAYALRLRLSWAWPVMKNKSVVMPLRDTTTGRICTYGTPVLSMTQAIYMYRRPRILGISQQDGCGWVMPSFALHKRHEPWRLCRVHKWCPGWNSGFVRPSSTISYSFIVISFFLRIQIWIDLFTIIDNALYW